MKKIITPFGIGFASNEQDYENLKYFIEGLKASLSFFGMKDEEPEVEYQGFEGDFDLDTEEETNVFSSRKELLDLVATYLEGNYMGTVYDDTNKLTRRIKLSRSRITDSNLELVKSLVVGKGLKGRNYDFEITDVRKNIETTGGWYSSPEDVCIYMKKIA